MIDIIYRFDAHYRKDRPAPATPGEAKKRLEDGNRLFAELLEAEDKGLPHEPRVIPFDLQDMGFSDVDGKAPTQMPFAAVLGCADARVPTEIVFSQGCNDLFVVRVAGNVLGSECLGSLDYAVKHLGKSLKLLVVLAHSNCGAVTAAVDAFLYPAKYMAMAGDHSLRTLVDRIMVAVRSAAHSLETVWGAKVVRKPGYRHALIDLAVVQNAALNAIALDVESREHGATGFGVAFGVYDLVHRRVGIPVGGKKADDGWTWRLSKPPANQIEFDRLAESIAAGPICKKALATKPQR